MKNAFARNLKKYREKNDLTQRQLAEMAGITATSISSYEKEAMSPSLEIVEKLACALDINIVDLICDNQLSNINPKTYADVIQLLYSISQNADIAFDESEYDNLGNISSVSLRFFDGKLNQFLVSWAKMEQLVKDKIIEKSLLDYWIKQQAETHDEEITNLPF